MAEVADGLSEAAVPFEVAPAAVAVAGAVVAAISATGDPAIWARKSWRCSSCSRCQAASALARATRST